MNIIKQNQYLIKIRIEIYNIKYQKISKNIKKFILKILKILKIYIK